MPVRVTHAPGENGLRMQLLRRVLPHVLLHRRRGRHRRARDSAAQRRSRSAHAHPDAHLHLQPRNPGVRGAADSAEPSGGRHSCAKPMHGRRGGPLWHRPAALAEHDHELGRVSGALGRGARRAVRGCEPAQRFWRHRRPVLRGAPAARRNAYHHHGAGPCRRRGSAAPCAGRLCPRRRHPAPARRAPAVGGASERPAL